MNWLAGFKLSSAKQRNKLKNLFLICRSRDKIKMGNKKAITIEHTINKSTIRVTSFDGKFDFAKNSTHVLVYFNDLLSPKYDFYAELLISHRNQPQTTVFDLEIPSGSQFATLVFTTVMADSKIDSI